MSRILRQKYINVFIMLGDSSYLSDIREILGSICSTTSCNYEIKQSIVIDRFYYIRIKDNDSIHDIKQKIEKSLGELSDKVSWFKVELIDVK